MSTEIYYFSGTGNSLVVARDIARKTKGKLIPIPSVMDKESIKTDVDVIGIVFPVYHGGIPPIIRRFVKKMENIDKKYIFGVCTYGDGPGLAIKYLSKIIKSRGGKLAAGFAVNMPYNYVIPSFFLREISISFVLREIPINKQQGMFSKWNRKLENIYEFVSAKKEGKYETSSEIIGRLVDSIDLRDKIGKSIWLKMAGFEEHTDLSFWESIQLMDWGFTHDEKCNSCGTCSRICPVNDIKIVDSGPLWQHHCEQCFACLQWCPNEAIQFGGKTSKGKRYHHPDVDLSDMLVESKGVYK